MVRFPVKAIDCLLFSPPDRARPDSGAHAASNSVGTWGILRGSEVAGNTDDHSPPPSAKLNTLRMGLLNCLNARSRGLIQSEVRFL